MNSFNIITEFYKKEFDIDEEIVKLLADFEICSLSISGMSNLDISSIIGVSEEEISSTLNLRLGFGGFKETLKFQPLFSYRVCSNRNFEEFRKLVQYEYEYRGDMAELFDVCKKFEEIEEIVSVNWR